MLGQSLQAGVFAQDLKLSVANIQYQDLGLMEEDSYNMIDNRKKKLNKSSERKKDVKRQLNFLSNF